MGSVFCKLMDVLCCPPCLSSIVSKLAFCPPVPGYKIDLIDGVQHVMCDINPDQQEYVEYHSIETGNKGIIAAVYLKTAEPHVKTTLILSHGNAVDIGYICRNLIELGLELNVNIFTYDYSGYGISSGSPSESQLYHNAVSVLEYAQIFLSIQHSDIILYGQSIGTVPTSYLASKYRFGVVILHSPLASGFNLINTGCLLTCCPCLDVLNNLYYAKKFQSPTMIIHGTHDEVIPVEHSYMLLRKIPKELQLTPLFIEGAGHNDCDFFPVYKTTLKSLIQINLPELQNDF